MSNYDTGEQWVISYYLISST